MIRQKIVKNCSANACNEAMVKVAIDLTKTDKIFLVTASYSIMCTHYVMQCLIYKNML